jgi:hypothetical protein
MAIDLAELRSLSPAKKLQIITLLWNELHESGIPELSEAEWEVIERRDRYMTKYPEESLTTEQMWARVDELLK